jgi:hypothetical protein
VERKCAWHTPEHEVAETPVEALDLSVRVFNSLKRTGITTVGDVLDLLEKGEQPSCPSETLVKRAWMNCVTRCAKKASARPNK